MTTFNSASSSPTASSSSGSSWQLLLGGYGMTRANTVGLCGYVLTDKDLENVHDLKICLMLEEILSKKLQVQEEELDEEYLKQTKELLVLTGKLKALVTSSSRHSDCPERLELKKSLESQIIAHKIDVQLQLIISSSSSPQYGEIQMIIPGLYISSQFPALDRFKLEACGITDIVMCMDFPPPFPQHFKYLVLKVKDEETQKIRMCFDDSFHFISRARTTKRKNVLVHCAAGISRSCTIAIAYLMREYRLTANEGLALVRNSRPFVCPNQGFANQLMAYEKELFTS
jgi:hypothetical protein